MALSFSTKNVISKQMGGVKLRLVAITFDALYVSGTGYTITAASLGLRKILNMTGGNLGVFNATPVISGTGINLKCYKGASGANVECATNEATLSGVVGMFTVWGY